MGYIIFERNGVHFFFFFFKSSLDIFLFLQQIQSKGIYLYIFIYFTVQNYQKKYLEMKSIWKIFYCLTIQNVQICT